MSTTSKSLGRVPDLAERLDVTRHRAYELARERRVPGIVRVGRQIRVDMQAVEEWIQAGGDLMEAGAGR